MKRIVLSIALLAAAPVAGAQSSSADTSRAAKQPAYFEFQVEQPVVPGKDAPVPVYPPELRAQHVEGRVLAQFVVGLDGRADMRTFKVLESTNDLFTRAVSDAVKNANFVPARVEGRAVKQVVQQPFVFALPPASSAP